MPYVKMTVKAGKTIEIYKYHSYRYGSTSKARKGNENATQEKQQQINQRNSERKLKWLINENFTEGDIHLVVTYRRECRPDIDTAVRERSNMIKRFGRVYKKAGIEFKYIAVTEYQNKAIHHHIILPKIDVSLLQDKWPHGRVRPTYLYGDDFGDLAAYLIKETSKSFKNDEFPLKKRWSASKNLRKPKIVKQVMKSKMWQEIPKPIKGYYVVKESICDYVNESGYLSQSYTMRKLE